jgi:hypothetical protein
MEGFEAVRHLRQGGRPGAGHLVRGPAPHTRRSGGNGGNPYPRAWSASTALNISAPSASWCSRAAGLASLAPSTPRVSKVSNRNRAQSGPDARSYNQRSTRDEPARNECAIDRQPGKVAGLSIEPSRVDGYWSQTTIPPRARNRSVFLGRRSGCSTVRIPRRCNVRDLFASEAGARPGLCVRQRPARRCSDYCRHRPTCADGGPASHVIR